MFDFHEKRRIRGIVYSIPSILIVFMVAGLIFLSVEKRYSVEREMAEKLEVKEAELNVLKERATALEANVEHLRNERGIEEEIRTRFDVAKEGEQVIIILDDEKKTQVATTTSGSTDQPGKRSFFDVLKFW